MLSVRALLLILAASAVAGCGDDYSASTATTPATTAASTQSDVTAPEKTVPTCVADSTERIGSNRETYAAVVQERAQAYRTPDGRQLASFGPKNVNGVPTVFGVLAKRVDADCEAKWYRVQLPLKPNGSIGWVRASDVKLAPVTTRIVVDLSERRVTLFDHGEHVLDATAAIGSPQTPTPLGRYYVNQRLVPDDVSGPFGPGAIGISAFSEVLTGWTQGGPIAIHGTNRPDLLGRAVSNGCIRVRNDLLRQLFERTLAGTPVTVRA